MHLESIFTFKGHSRERVNLARVKEAESDNIWRTATVWHKVVSSSDLQANVTFCQDNSCQKQGWEGNTFFWISLRFVLCSLIKTFSALFSQNLFLSQFSTNCEQFSPNRLCFTTFLVGSSCLLSSCPSTLSIHMGKGRKSEVTKITAVVWQAQGTRTVFAPDFREVSYHFFLLLLILFLSFPWNCWIQTA